VDDVERALELELARSEKCRGAGWVLDGCWEGWTSVQVLCVWFWGCVVCVCGGGVTGAGAGASRAEAISWCERYEADLCQSACTSIGQHSHSSSKSSSSNTSSSKTSSSVIAYTACVQSCGQQWTARMAVAVAYQGAGSVCGRWVLAFRDAYLIAGPAGCTDCVPLGLEHACAAGLRVMAALCALWQLVCLLASLDAVCAECT
jgi:hypothetical protein